MFALLEIARIYKALKRFADLQGPICYNDAQNKEMNLLLDIIRVKFAYHFRINYDLDLETAEFLELGLCDFGETLFSARHCCALRVAERFSRKNAGNSRFSTQTSKGRCIITT